MSWWKEGREVDLDLIEIGTSDYDTLISSASDESYGITIEPLKLYLDKLPNKKNILKLNCAISMDDNEKEDYIFYLDPNDIKNYPMWLRGCNQFGDFHHEHKKHNLTHLVKKQKVKLIPIKNILLKYKIRKIKLLKIDTEGFDIFILENLIPYWKSKSKDYWPEKIEFESHMDSQSSNHWPSKEKMIEVIFEYLNLGYKLINVDFKGVSNTVLELKENKKEIEKKLIPYLNARNIVFKRTIEIIKTIKQNNYKNFIEIGVWFGNNILAIAKELPNILCYGIDPYSSGSYEKEMKNLDDKYILLDNYSEQIYNSVLKSSKNYNNVKIIRENSKNASYLFQDETIDLIFIDANHSYEEVKNDILYWLPKVRQGGCISGHDYNYFKTVKQAVDELLGLENIILGEDDTWFYFKQ